MDIDHDPIGQGVLPGKFHKMEGASYRDIKPGINPVPDAGGFVIPLPPRISDVKHMVVINIKIRLGNNAQPFVIIPFPQIQTSKKD